MLKNFRADKTLKMMLAKIQNDVEEMTGITANPISLLRLQNTRVNFFANWTVEKLLPHSRELHRSQFSPELNFIRALKNAR